MFYRVSGIKLKNGEDESLLLLRCAEKLRILPSEILKISLYRKSIDARKKTVEYVYTIDVYLKSNKKILPSPQILVIEKEYEYRIPSLRARGDRPVVVGFGPSGMFAALLLAKAGLRPIVLERGKEIEKRIADVRLFFQSGTLDEESNIQYGEGGAGTFSDGKLNTLLKDKNHRGRFVLKTFADACGADEILYLNKPHLGTDRLRVAVKHIRREIEALGGEIRFETQFLSPLTEKGKICGARILENGKSHTITCSAIFLGIGHSARNTFLALRESGVAMEKKVFSVGVRIEHLQREIDRTQFGSDAARLGLPSADYKLSCLTFSGKRLYTFCMCPGGEVVAATGCANAVVTNGMSNSGRDGKNANSALLINVFPDELDPDLFAGFHYQKRLEEKAFSLGGGEYRAPCQLVGDFLKDQNSRTFGKVIPTYSRGVNFAPIRDLIGEEMAVSLKEGLQKMGRMLNGFDAPDAVLTGVESRATCPVRILRGEDYQSNVIGLYPIGEGAGFAGGIMSSAMDGMKAVESYFKNWEENT